MVQIDLSSIEALNQARGNILPDKLDRGGFSQMSAIRSRVQNRSSSMQFSVQIKICAIWAAGLVLNDQMQLLWDYFGSRPGIQE